MKIRPEDAELFASTGAKRWLNRKRLPRPNALLPLTYDPNPRDPNSAYLHSMDPRALALTESLALRLSQEFPVDVLPNGFAGASAIPGDFLGLVNVSGYGMDPLPIPITSNDSFIEANKLAAKIRPEDEPWLREIIRLFFGHAVPADLHIRKAASTGFPWFTNDNTYKKLATLKCLKEVDSWLELAGGGKTQLRQWLADYHCMYLYAIQERQQPNSIKVKKGDLAVARALKELELESKGRTAPTETEARGGSYAGGTVADMSVHDANGNLIANHFAMRRRDVFGANGVVNYTLTAVMGCFRAVYLKRFEFTYKTRDRFDKQRKIERYSYVVGSDVKTMDKLIPRWFSEFVFRELPKYLDERVVTVMQRLFQAPYVVPPPWRKTSPDYNPVFGGSPFDEGSFTNHVGLPSGIAFNPDWGKLWMTFVYAVLYKDVGALLNPAEIEPWLRGQNSQHALLDMSDDAAFLTNSATIAERFRNPKSPYAVLEVETPVIFLGDVFCDVGGKKEVYPNPITYVVNALCREDSISRNGPVAWAEGVIARNQVYSSTPTYRDMNRIYEEECRRHIGINPNLLARSLAKQQRFNDVDAMVRANPHVLHYKVDPKDVSPEVLDEVVATIPASDFFNDIKHLFKVPTVSLED